MITGYAVTDSVIMKASIDTHGEARFSRENYTSVIQNLLSALRIPVKIQYSKLIQMNHLWSIGRFVFLLLWSQTLFLREKKTLHCL